MIGKIHYARYGRVRIMVDGGHVYYTNMIVSNCPFENRQLVRFDVSDSYPSLAENLIRIQTEDES